MINIIHRAFALFQIRHVPDRFNQIFFFKNAAFEVHIPIQLLIHLIPAHPAEIIPPRVKK